MQEPLNASAMAFQAQQQEHLQKHQELNPQPVIQQSLQPAPAPVAQAPIPVAQHQQLVQPQTQQVEPRQAVSEIEFTLPDGRTVRMAPPPVAVPMLLQRILGEFEDPRIAMTYTKPLLYISHINGQPVMRPTDRVTAEALMIELGDQAVDICTVMYNDNWGSFTFESLKVIKKNLRG